METVASIKNILVTLDRIQIICLSEEETTESHGWNITENP